ncbi:MAG: NifU family protein [Actinomycetota bacterium]|nr:NifU family protein [Actinomycetota bacterium]
MQATDEGLTDVGQQVSELPARIETLLDELESLGDPFVSGRAQDLVAAVVGLYGAGLTRIVELLGASRGGEDLVRLLVDDELVANLLMLHDLHPDDVGVRVQAALDRVRPYLGAHAGGIEFLGVDENGIAQLKLEGSCDGCAGSAATVRNAVERAVLEAVPEVVGVEVEGMVEEKPATPGLLQIGMRCPDGLAEAVGA